MQQTSRRDNDAAEAISRFQAYARLVSVDPERNRFRYYSLTWQPGLWGGGALVRRWGRIGRRDDRRRPCTGIDPAPKETSTSSSNGAYDTGTVPSIVASQVTAKQERE
jgi:hypothetical protein